MFAHSIRLVSCVALTIGSVLCGQYAAADRLQELREDAPVIEHRGPEIRPLSSIRLVQHPTDSPPLGIPADVPRPVIQLPPPPSAPDLWVVSPAYQIVYPYGTAPNCFEDTDLERCGKACGCLTEAVSVIHFGGRIALLPVLMTCER